VTWPPERAIIAPANDDERAALRRVQRALRLAPTGEMDDATKASLRGVQALFKAPVTGVLDRQTVTLIERLVRTHDEES
jgi:hypothetical protein